MKILVGVKHVPDTETKIKIAADGASLDPAAVSKWIPSPYDEYAAELALQLRDAQGDSEVVAVVLGPDAAQTTLRQILAMGADHGVLVADDGFTRCDALVRARALARIVEEQSPDLVVLGKYGVGTDEGQTGPMLAELLGWPHVTAVSRFELTDGGFTAERPIEGAVEVVEGSLPAVVSCDKGLNEPRYPSLKGIMQAKKKPLVKRSASDVGVEAGELSGGALVWESMELPPPRAAGKQIPGDAASAANELARILQEEIKVI